MILLRRRSPERRVDASRLVSNVYPRRVRRAKRILGVVERLVRLGPSLEIDHGVAPQGPAARRRAPQTRAQTREQIQRENPLDDADAGGARDAFENDADGGVRPGDARAGIGNRRAVPLEREPAVARERPLGLGRREKVQRARAIHLRLRRFRAAIGIRRAMSSTRILLARRRIRVRVRVRRRLGRLGGELLVLFVFVLVGVEIEIGIVAVVAVVVVDGVGDEPRAGYPRATRVRGGASADDGRAVSAARRAVRAAEPRVVASRRRLAHPETQRVRARRARLAPEHRLRRVRAVAHATRRHVGVRGGGERVGRAGESPRIGEHGASLAFAAAQGFLFDGVDARGARGEKRRELRVRDGRVALVPPLAPLAAVAAALVAADGDGVFAHAAEVRRAVLAVHLLG